MYKIIFIDEVEADIRRFQRYVHQKDTDKQFEVIGQIPLENIDEFIDNMMSDNIDAIISDFQLSEYMPKIRYNGVELIEKILKQREKFPCFVMTSHDDQAVATSADVNIVYIKALMNKENNVKITFLERVKKQIDHYKAGISNAQNEFNRILEKSESDFLTASEEARLEELDSFLEKALNQESKIPPQLKRKSTLKDLHKLIDNTDDLLKKLDSNDK